MSIDKLTFIQNNISDIQQRIDFAAQKYGRKTDQIKLIVVTKGHPAEMAEWAIQAGARFLGENYAQEGAEKRQALRHYSQVEWHMIGHIQSRKSQLVCDNYDYIHSVDSIKLASHLNDDLLMKNKRMPVLLEVNVSGETSKTGLPGWDDKCVIELIPKIRDILSLPGLEVLGLMTMAPFFDIPEEARPYFRRLREIRDRLRVEFPDMTWNELSMGMSGDFEIAIQEGATMVRIGQAILGPRPSK